MRKQLTAAMWCLAIILLVGLTAQAATRTVDNTSDNGALTACTAAANDCSLRGAIANAATNDTINFDATLFSTPQTINLGTWIFFSGNITLQIVGPGANLLTITGTGNTNGMFYLLTGNTTVQNLTFANIIGNSVFGVNVANSAVGKIENCVFHDITVTNAGPVSGAVYSAFGNGNVTVNNSEFYNNTVAINTDGVTAISGVTVRNTINYGILTSGNTTITNSIIKDNVGNNTVGIFYNGNNSTLLNISNSIFSGNTNTSGNGNGAVIVMTQGNIAINNSTISGNSATRGSALYVSVNSSGSTVKLNNTTVTGNATASDGAVDTGVTATSTMRNTIIAGNTGNARPDLSGKIVTSSNNLIGIVNNNYTGIVDANGNPINNNLVGTQANPLNPRLASIANNGGATQTFALLANSPAVNAGNNCVLTANGCGDNNTALTTDQRGAGFPRQVDSNIDIGAFESNFITVLNDANSGAGSLRSAIANSPAGATIVFSPAYFNQPRTITLTSGQILINKNLTIIGTGANQLTIDGNNASRIFNNASGFTFSVYSVKLTRGDSGVNPGGCVSNNGTFNLADSEITNCKGSSGGAIFNDFDATLNVTNSTLAANQAVSGEGGAVSNGGLFLIKNSTVSSNSAVSSKGGGIYNFAPNSTGIYVNNATVANNNSNYGGGVFNEFGTGSFVSARNTIFAGNTGTTRGNDFDGAVCSGGNNLFGDANWAGIACNTASNILNVSPQLAPLGDYGGTTRTHAPLPTSPVLNAGNDCVLTANGCGDNNAALSVDQRGALRKIGAATDIGAFERSITFDQNTLPNGRQTVAYSQQLSATRATSLTDDLLMTENLDSNILLAPFTFSVVTVSGQQLPPGLTLSSSGLLAGVATQAGTFTFTVKAADTDGIAGVHQYTVTILANTAPTISGATVSRRACLPVSNSQIATADDAENGANGVNVTITSANPSGGVTVSNITNTNGTITANVVANCSANENVTFTLAASDGNLTTNAVLTVNITPNAAPTISGATVSRNASKPVSNSQIATVDDFETGANGVTVTVTSANPSNGVTVSNIVNTNGNVTANVVADCGATNATFTLTASDGSLTTNGSLTVNVVPNAAPTVQYPASAYYYGNTLNVLPTVATDESTISFAIQNVSPALTNAPTINSATGRVSLASGNQAGSYTVTVRVTDVCGATTDAPLPLEVTRIRVVNETTDLWDGVCDADCSLRDAVESANSGDIVAFSPLFDSPQTISLSYSRPFVINTPLTINGPGANLLTVNGNNLDHVFFINPTNDVTIRGMKIIGGRGFQGGSGIFSLAQDVTLENLVITDNHTTSTSPGGGIAVRGAFRMNIYNSFISNNSAEYGGGLDLESGAVVKIYNSTISGNTVSRGNFWGGGGIYASDATVYLSNSTLSGNSAPNSVGGGISAGQAGQFFINNSTITDNSAVTGGGIYRGSNPQPYYNVRNTIIAGNNAANDPDVNGDFGFLSSVFSNSLIGNSGSATGFNGTNNQIGTSVSPINARLAPLGDYGGTTPTHALLPDSPALNAGSDCVLTANGCGNDNPALTNDQRGSERKIGSSADIGAFEKNIALDPPTLPNGTRNVFYTQQLSATRATSLTENLLTTKDVGSFNSGLPAPFTFSVISVSGQQLPPGLALAPNGILSGTPTQNGTYIFTVKAADADGIAGVQQYSVTIETVNIPPTISGATLARQAGSPVSNSQIGSVNDVEVGANGVIVTVTSANPSNGVTISNIVNTNGTITADIIADCGAANATFTLTATANERTANGTLTVNVSPNTAPTLAYPSPQSTFVGNPVDILPSARSDNGAVTYSIVSVTPGLTSPPTVDSNAKVSFASAEPVGSYTIVVRATDNCGLTTDASFTLDVTPPPTNTVTKIEDTQDYVCDDDCSLREAIFTSYPGGYIQFSPLFDTPQTIAINSELEINRNVTIEGKGANLLTIDAQNLPDVRVFKISGSVTIKNLTVTRGNLTDPGSFDGGGGILVQSGGTLNLVNAVVDNNSSLQIGGGIAAEPGSTLTVVNSRITNNHITGNTLGGAGISISNSNFYMTASTVSGNITPTLPTSNPVGGGLFINNSNPINNNPPFLARIENSTVSGNRAVSGGGIVNVAGNLFMSNVTVSGNTSLYGASGIRSIDQHSITLRNCTIASNAYGGIEIFSGGTINLANTIVADNGGYDISGLSGNFVNRFGANIVETGVQGNVTVGGSGTILQADPHLAALGNYGGLTQTHAIIANSPAINAGSNTEALDTLGAALTFDQRGSGSPRIAGTTVDIGAFESNIIFDQTTLPNASTSAFYSQTLTVVRQTGFAESAVPENLAPFTFSIIGGALPTGLSLAPNGLLSGTPTQTGAFAFTVKAVDGTDTLAGVKQFVIQVFAPTAANASVSGRILTAEGGLRNARVILTDSQGNSQTVSTGTFGYYRFDNVAVGETYIVSVVSRRFTFASQVISVMDHIAELNFTAIE